MSARTARSIKTNLLGLAGRIGRAEKRLDTQYALRLLLWQDARSIDPATGEPITDPTTGKPVPTKATVAEVAEWSGVSEQAVHKALRKARTAVGTGTPKRGRYR